MKTKFVSNEYEIRMRTEALMQGESFNSRLSRGTGLNASLC
jgi:hypothetical protein